MQSVLDVVLGTGLESSDVCILEMINAPPSALYQNVFKTEPLHLPELN